MKPNSPRKKLTDAALAGLLASFPKTRLLLGKRTAEQRKMLREFMLGPSRKNGS